MRPPVPANRPCAGQAGFTLIELLIATTIGVLILTALTSVVLTTFRADQAAIGRTEVAGEIRTFQQVAYDDFASSALPSTPGGCGTSARPCTTDPIELHSCSLNSLGDPVKWVFTYQWLSSTQVIQRNVRKVDSTTKAATTTTDSAASSVVAFAWYVDGATPNQSVVVTLTVQLKAITESQTMRFYPRVESQLPQFVAAPC